MTCEHGCFEVGGEWIAENPACPEHGKTLTENERRRFKRAVDDLNRLLEEVRAKGIHDANWYLGMEILYLMRGPSHSGYKESAQGQNILASEPLKRSGGGDW